MNYTHFSRRVRQCGKTTVLAKAAKEIDAIFVVGNTSHKKSLKRKFPDLKIIAYGEYSKLRGEPNTPVIFDHYVNEIVIKELESEIRHLNCELEKKVVALKKIERIASGKY